MPFPTPYVRRSKYTINFEVLFYTKDIDTGACLEPVEIKREEFDQIFKDNLQTFNCMDNKPAQTTSWFYQEVSD